MKILLVGCFLLAGCEIFNPKFAPEVKLTANVAACNASTANVIARGKARGDSCEVIKAAVETLWSTDTDCLSYGVSDAGTLECK